MSSYSNVRTLAILTILGSSAIQQTSAAYSLLDDYTGDKFFSGFNFFSDVDPTNGFVQYQTKAAAIEKSLVGYLADTLVTGGQPEVSSVYIGVDYQNKADNNTGRLSVRLEGKKGYDTALLIADVLHMPGASGGSWPALWTLGMDAEWPTDGEIDLLEGVHRDLNNAITLHTTEGCTIPAEENPAEFTGTVNTPNCYVKAKGQKGNAGCSIHMANASSPNDPTTNYGDAFNVNGGGVYALEWTPAGIRAWFFPRAAAAEWPKSVLSGALDPGEFGIPAAAFTGDGCDYTKHFKKQRIIINTTFWGQWAGKTWEEDGCRERTGVETCIEYVRENPEAFKNAYWEFRSLKVFENLDVSFFLLGYPEFVLSDQSFCRMAS